MPSALRLTLPLLLAVSSATAQSPQPFQFAREGVLGTSSLLVVQAEDEATATKVEAAVFDEVERLRLVLSTWDEDSELTRLVHAGTGKVSSELAGVLRLASSWREISHGAFEPGVAALTRLWTDAAAHGAEPAAAALQAVVSTFAEPPWSEGQGTFTLRGPVCLDAMAKGFIVDRAVAAGTAVSKKARVDSFQIGGDMRVGSSARDVAVIDPRQPAANGKPLATVHLTDRALASSGGYERGFEVGGVHHSHILDPRTGRPCDKVLGASAVAPDATTADALATVLCVLGHEAGLALLAKVEGAEGIVVAADGSVHESRGWKTLLAPPPAAAAAGTPWPDGFSLQVDFTIKAPAAPEGGRRRGGWKRPYIAVWVEDENGTPARTLCLWIEDQRWLRDLRRWSRQHAGVKNLVELVSQATRKAGNYTLTWDGTDEEGRKVAPGRYAVLIEAAREHGTYQLMRSEIELGGKTVSVEIPGNAEIEHATLRFDRAKPAAKLVR